MEPINSGSYEYEEALKRAWEHQERLIKYADFDERFFNFPTENKDDKERV